MTYLSCRDRRLPLSGMTGWCRVAITHQQAADTRILELGTRWVREDVNAIVEMAETLAGQRGSPELTRAHLSAAETLYIRQTCKQSKNE